MFRAFIYRNTNSCQQKWERWKIKSYRILLQVNWDYLNFEREILSDTISLEVCDHHVYFLENYTPTPYVNEEDNWTILGLFEQVNFYSDVQYNDVYGFPKKLGNAEIWIIKVLNFKVLDYEVEKTSVEWLEDLRYELIQTFHNLSHNFKWYYLSVKSIILGRRQTISLKDFLMTGDFGGIQMALSKDEVARILCIALNSDKVFGINTIEVAFQYDSASYLKYNCNKFEDKPYPPTIYVKGFHPVYEDTTIDEFIGYLEYENISYEIKWEQFANVRFPCVYINNATKANFAEDTFTIMGIYPLDK